MSATEDPEARYLVPALERGLAILMLFTAERPRLTAAEIALSLGVSRSTVFRLIYTLEHHGFLERIDQRFFRIGTPVLALGFKSVAGRDMLDVARPLLEALRDATNASAHLGVLEGRDVCYLLRVPARQMLISNIGVGSRLPAHCTTMGRVLLGGLSVAELATRLRAGRRNQGAPVAAGSWPDFVAMIAADRARGHVAADSAYERGLVSVAAPIFNAQGELAAAINLSAPAALLSLEDAAATLVPRVLGTARAISRALGAEHHLK